MDPKPVNLTEALASFDDVFSARVAARMNDYDVKIAKAKGEHVWHVHDATDEFFLVLEGQFDIAMRDSDGRETTVTLGKSDTFVVPKGTLHKPSSPGCSVLMFEPSGTSGTGDHTRARSRPTSTAPPAGNSAESTHPTRVGVSPGQLGDAGPFHELHE